MEKNKKYSADPKVKLLSLKEFMDAHWYLVNLSPKRIWKDDTIPEASKSYYKFTSNFFIFIDYTFSPCGFGLNVKEKLNYIEVAFRDGKTEYKLIDAKIAKLQTEQKKHKYSKKIKESIESLKNLRLLIPPYKISCLPVEKPFESYLVDSGYKTENAKLMSKYLVFDIESNGIRKANDDLLSLTIYDPTTGICYNRFFPLDLQPLILTTHINGITDETITDMPHMSQKEMDWLIDYFHMKERTLLSFSGGNGTFDPAFVSNYCKRHKIQGFDNLKFENIKNKIPKAPFGTEGQLSKDNLCRLFGINGVNEVHSSLNDCLLEWKLFEKIEEECVFFINEHLYKFNPEYIIPYSYLFQHNELVKYAGIKIPDLKSEITELFKIKFPKKVINQIKKYPTNITGVTIEHGINTLLQAERQNNIQFLSKNKSHLEYIGSLDSNIRDIPIIAENDGTVRAINEEDKEFINSVNETTKLFIEHIQPLADYLKNNIFTNGNIMSQELSISNDKKVLALCDLSDKNNVVEIKTYAVVDKNNNLSIDIARQLYYQAKGRNTYVLSIIFDKHESKNYTYIVDDINIVLYKVDLTEYSVSDSIKTFALNKEMIKVLNLINAKPSISITELSERTNILYEKIKSIINVLIMFGYIKKKYPHTPRSSFIILRSPDDILTKYKQINTDIDIIND